MGHSRIGGTFHVSQVNLLLFFENKNFTESVLNNNTNYIKLSRFKVQGSCLFLFLFIHQNNAFVYIKGHFVLKILTERPPLHLLLTVFAS